MPKENLLALVELARQRQALCHQCSFRISDGGRRCIKEGGAVCSLGRGRCHRMAGFQKVAQIGDRNPSTSRSPARRAARTPSLQPLLLSICRSCQIKTDPKAALAETASMHNFLSEGRGRVMGEEGRRQGPPTRRQSRIFPQKRTITNRLRPPALSGALSGQPRCRCRRARRSVSSCCSAMTRWTPARQPISKMYPDPTEKRAAGHRLPGSCIGV